ncbi:hypothetical protein GW17_00016063 [Ensete ventricosum]|nr:hypothetical protein GW17_00016063 [Ensete ventricosum]RZS01740.1 hypothetical protein BHM03_00031656 [Ensete ventricosum]
MGIHWPGNFFSLLSLSFQLELKLGLGGTSYADFIRGMHLPMQLRYCLGCDALSIKDELYWFAHSYELQKGKTLRVCPPPKVDNSTRAYEVRINTDRLRYLACARCSSTGALVLIQPVATVNDGDQPLSPPQTERCSNCSGSGKVGCLQVMCPTCLCTGMAMASEHDPRIDPFD